MKKEIKERWIKALRSGDYRQAKYKLKLNENTMCCLGVLCDITKKETGGDWDHNSFGIDGDVTSDVLPKIIADKLGISYDSQFFAKGTSESTQLSELNDTGSTFRDIANIIDENF